MELSQAGQPVQSDRQAVEDAEAVARILDVVMARARVELKGAVELLASKPDGEFFGQSEFAVRDMVHRLGAVVMEAALEERKKGGTWGRRRAVRIARSRCGSSTTATRD